MAQPSIEGHLHVIKISFVYRLKSDVGRLGVLLVPVAYSLAEGAVDSITETYFTGHLNTGAAKDGNFALWSTLRLVL